MSGVEYEAGRDEWRREISSLLFWIERLFLILVLVFPTYLTLLIVPLILSTTLLALPFFLFFCPHLSSVGPSGIGGFWLFLLDRSTFYLGLEYSKLLAKGFELAFLWRLTVFLSLVVHSIYIADHLLRSHPPPAPTSTDEGDVSKELKELVEDGKKMMTDMEHMIHSGLETLRRDDGKTYNADVVKCPELATQRDSILAELLDDLRSKVDEDIRSSRQYFNKDVKSVADQLHETYLVVQETAKDAKARADKAHETYRVQSKRGMIRGEDVEGFVELKEQVRRISVEAEIAAEELSRVEAGIQQWEEDNAHYLASLPLLYCNHN
ncbi:unnamed protein product [Thlaspi arvense]|uniref:Uncharacterized protein n=1 Tax=Thlaspi arvense TaxID=13288 RepID=A0AAU9SG77_THLAR|nr:unnamed protein product [Thlaspi arvense]